MGSSKNGGESSASTLVLVDDAEYELYTSRSAIVFPNWNSVEAKGRQRTVSVSLSLCPRSLDDANAVSASASVPLVITAPMTSRFQLQCGSSLLLLLRVGSPLEFEVQFVPPRDCDFGTSNFQDQIVIQTRLAKLTIRLSALRERPTIEGVDPDTFEPRILPTVKAPLFKLFDQIERDAAALASQALRSSSHRVSVSASFHPQKNTEHRIDSLAPVPPRQPNPPLPYSSISRPSSSSHRRTPSPRVLEPLSAEVPLAPTIVTAAVDNQAEAREVILRLRARRSSLHSTTTPKLHETNDLHSQPTCPESHLDAKAKAELEEFHALVKAAKLNVAGERTKAKHELDYYKSLLLVQPSASIAGLSLAPTAEQNSDLHNGSLKKPARLPSLPQDIKSQWSDSANHPRVDDKPKTTNQECSPVKRSHLESLSTTAVKPTQDPKTLRKSTPSSMNQRPTQATAPKPHAGSNPLGSKSAANKSLTNASAVKTIVAFTKPTKQKATVKKTPVAIKHDRALDDFDDVDPEIDDAPVLPDDLQTRWSGEDEEDDIMLTMKVPLY